MVEIGPKVWFFWLILRVFCLYPLILCELRPRFCQMKNLIQIYTCDKFLPNSICGCEVKNFLSFSYWFSTLEIAPFFRKRGGAVSSPYSHKYFSILLKFWAEVVFRYEKHSVWKILQKFGFWLKWKPPKVYSFGPFWGPIYNSKTKKIA